MREMGHLCVRIPKPKVVPGVIRDGEKIMPQRYKQPGESVDILNIGKYGPVSWPYKKRSTNIVLIESRYLGSDMERFDNKWILKQEESKSTRKERETYRKRDGRERLGHVCPCMNKSERMDSKRTWCSIITVGTYWLIYQWTVLPWKIHFKTPAAQHIYIQRDFWMLCTYALGKSRGGSRGFVVTMTYINHSLTYAYNPEVWLLPTI